MKSSRRTALRLLPALALMGAGWPAQADTYVDFFRAVAIDHVGGVRAALDKGLDPNSLSEYGQCALYLAIREDNPKVTELLIAAPGVNLNQRNAAGETPLMMAALKGNLPVMQRLLQAGVPPHHEGWSPLHYAATGPSVAAVRLLLERGAPVDAPSSNGSTPLMMAARYGAEGSVELLAARGASLQQRNLRGMDAADFARGADRDWMLRTLRRLGYQDGGR